MVYICNVDVNVTLNFNIFFSTSGKDIGLEEM